MPIYEYNCASCGHEFEELAKSMADSKTVKCPSCGKMSGERKLSVFAAREGAVRPSGPPGGERCAGCPGMDGSCPL